MAILAKWCNQFPSGTFNLMGKPSINLFAPQREFSLWGSSLHGSSQLKRCFASTISTRTYIPPPFLPSPNLRQSHIRERLDRKVLEAFILLAAANRAVHQAAHNRLSTRSLHAELIYSLSPNRNISDSLITFGIAETSRDLLVGIFDDESGEKMIEMAKKIDGRPVSLDELPMIADYSLIKKVYHVSEPEFNEETISDEIITRIVAKDYMG
ncbi:unnamed protein product [Toxocara canis]|uniref:EKC/KEOPS complex subunit CGI121 n=1 Tax=Toxocara canis TaxID=6265 RepID=A0A183UJ13_TOXCA|nr:unnamed protein product [Toxocara canis]